MTISVEVATIIDRPVEDVFRVLAAEHVENHPKWDPDINLEKVTEGAFGKGTLLKRINIRSGIPVEGTMEVLDYQENKSMLMKIIEGSVEIISRSSFESESPGKTLLRLSVEFSGLDPSIEKEVLSEQMQGAVSNHKRFVEATLSA